MRKFVNDYGCSMEFEDGISDAEINMRTSLLGPTCREVKKLGDQIIIKDLKPMR